MDNRDTSGILRNSQVMEKAKVGVTRADVVAMNAWDTIVLGAQGERMVSCVCLNN